MQRERIEYRDGDLAFDGYLARMGGSELRPLVLVFHAWSGESAVERARADELARLGYAAFAVDLYGKGVRGDLLGDNSALMGPLANDRRLLARRIAASLEAGKRISGVDPERVGAIGYCFGGLCALDLARSGAKGVRAVVSFHGILKAPPAPPAGPARGPIGAEVLVLHGYDDPMAPPNDVVELGNELTKHGATWELVAYGNTKHAFTFEGAQAPEKGLLFDARAARRSWATATSFLADALS
ncbi:MAG: dienelactone hydrolase family protein [Planctomycetaceae bacterium]|nr:dienelactone hydrolase family protein [Planctomycetaceae bacterium]